MPVKEVAPWDEGPLATHRIQMLNHLNLTTEERLWLGKLMHTDGVKASELAKFYGIPRNWLNKLNKKARENEVICQTKGKGKPFYLTPESCILLEQYLIEKHRTRTATEDEFKVKCQLLYDNQCLALGLAPVQQITVSNTFMKKMQKSIKLKLGPGQGKTKARYDAEKDPRNAYSEYVSLRCLKEGRDPNLICNNSINMGMFALPKQEVATRNFMIGTRDEYGQWDPELTSRALVTMDGEAIQINSIFSEEVRVLLELNLFDVAKHSASSSASTNAWDACPFFKANKKVMKSAGLISLVVAQGKHAIVRVIDKSLKDNIEDFCDKPKRDKIADALLRIIVSSQKTLNMSSIVKGFELTGQNPLNFAVKMNASYKGPRLSGNEWSHMQSDLVLNYLTEVFQRQGHIKECDFDAMNIKRVHDDRAADKDERVLHQQRFVLLTHDNTNERWLTHKRNIDNLAIPRTEMAKLKRKQSEDANEKTKQDKIQGKLQKQLDKQAQIDLQQKQKNDREEAKRLKSEEERQEKNKRKATAKVIDDDMTKIKKSRPKSSSSSSEVIMDEDNSNVNNTEEIVKFSSTGRVLKKKRLD